MKTIRFDQQSEIDVVAQTVADELKEGGLACIPCGGSYRIVADLLNENAVIELMQAKRRAKNSPVLLFVENQQWLERVASDMDGPCWQVAAALWPAPLTVRIRLNEELPGKVFKQLGGKKSRAGARVPLDPLARKILTLVGRPLLVSSANPEKKRGSESLAQVRKNFGRSVGILIDQGDLAPTPASTVVESRDGKLVIVRAGAVPEEQLTDYL